jgi:CDP-glucose 4,6-dehydratase
VTGAQGLIGCALVEKLLDRDEQVVALSRSDLVGSRFDTEGLRERCTLAEGDLADPESMRRVLDEHRVDTVVHLAAQSQVYKANRSPLQTWETNVRGTYMLLEALREHGEVARIVVASSDKAYGAHTELPYREDSALLASFPYDVSKAVQDMIARSYAATFGMPIAVTRLANVYGPGDVNWARVIPDTARSLALGERPVIRSDGTPERDYIYVEDAALAYVAVIDSLSDPAHHGRVWNAGSGEPRSVLEVVRTLIKVSGRDVEPEVRGDGLAGELDRQFLDATAIREELGWSPAWDLERGLRAAYDWYERVVTR